MTENGDHFDITTQVTCLSCIINMSGENIDLKLRQRISENLKESNFSYWNMFVSLECM